MILLLVFLKPINPVTAWIRLFNLIHIDDILRQSEEIPGMKKTSRCRNNYNGRSFSLSVF